MAYGIGAMARGLAAGQDQVFQDRDSRQMMGMRQEAHDQGMAVSKQAMETRASDAEWAAKVRERQGQQWAIQDQERETAERMKQALLSAEVSGDPTPLVEVYNEITGGLIQSFEPAGEGFVFIDRSGNKFELAREELMGFGASLLQPGKLTELRQAALAAERERLARIESESLKQGEWGTDADGNRAFRRPGQSYQPAPEMGADKVPAEVATNRYFAEVLGITEAEAINFRARMRDKSAGEAIQDIAKMIQDNSQASMRLGNDPVRIFAEAQRIYESMPQNRDFGIQSNAGRNQGPGPQGGNQGPGGGAAAEIDIDSIAQQAQAAIRAGASPNAIRDRLKERGFNDQQIQQIMGPVR